jgi:hypothetical protein
MKKNSGNRKTGEDIKNMEFGEDVDFEDEMDLLNLNRNRDERTEPKDGRGIWRPKR